jgi:hypothetical protein
MKVMNHPPVPDAKPKCCQHRKMPITDTRHVQDILVPGCLQDCEISHDGGFEHFTKMTYGLRLTNLGPMMFVRKNGNV